MTKPAKTVKPMKAEQLDSFEQLVFPQVASPKLDGIRCLIIDGVAMSNTLKSLPNKFVQAWAKTNAQNLNGLDGELIIGEHDKEVFNRTTSGIMSIKGEPDFTFHVFDKWDTPHLPYSRRFKDVKLILMFGPPRCKLVPTRGCASPEALTAFETEALAHGYEGVMVRKPESLYKYGRSTVKEGYLLKVKRFADAEAEVIGWGERMHNANEAKTDELGRTKRASNAEGMVPAGDLGYLKVKDCKTGIVFDVGGGFTAEQRVALWKNTSKLMGRILTYKHFPIGAVEKPRFPTFKGWRLDT